MKFAMSEAESVPSGCSSEFGPVAQLSRVLMVFSEEPWWRGKCGSSCGDSFGDDGGDDNMASRRSASSG